MTRIFTITHNAFREAVRDRVLYNLVVFVLLITIAAIFVGELSAGQESKVIVDLGLSASLLFGTFIAIFVGVGLVYKEIERRTVYAIFAKPVTRAEFLAGKYLGLCLTLLVNVAVMGAGVSVALLAVNRGWNSLAVQIWPAVFMIYLELMIITAVALLFSSFSSPALSALLTFCIFVIGHFSEDIKLLAASLESPFARVALQGLFYVLPNLANYSFITEAGHGITPGSVHMLGGVVYALFYVTALLAAAIMIFSRRNFK